jgi:hypothetical protein
VVDLVKLVKPDMMTFGGQAWAIGRTVSVPVERRRPVLCTGGVLHAYRSLELALLVGAAHGYGNDAVVLAATSPEVVVDDGTKVGVYELTPTHRIERPAWWADGAVRRRVQVRFAAICARAVLDVFERLQPGDDRPRRAIEAAEGWLAGRTDHAAAAAADADYAAYAAAYAARAAAADTDAAYAAAYAARAAAADTDAAYAADAAYYAAHAASYADDAANDANVTFDGVALARQAVVVEVGA